MSTAIDSRVQPTSADGLTRIPVRVARKEMVARRVVSLVLERTDGATFHSWDPGAHIDIHLTDELTRQYSLCPAEHPETELRISVLREPESRGGSEWVHDRIAVGDELTVSEPRNNFPMLPSRKYLFVAGGIGITPMLGMVEQAEREGKDWTLYYLGASSEDMAYAQELHERYGERVELHASSVSGRLDLRTILALPRAHMLVYVCGPEGLVKEVEDYCLGWPPGVLHAELFSNSLIGAGSNTDPFEVELRRTGRTVTVGPEETVLDKLDEQGVRVLSSCRAGLCGTCEVAVLAGNVEHRDAVLDDDTKDAGDVMLVCVSRAAAGCHKLTLDI